MRSWVLCGIGSLAATSALVGAGCSSTPSVPKTVAADTTDYTSEVCPRRSPAASARSAIHCVKRISTYNLDFGAQQVSDGAPLNGFVYTVACNGGDVYLENYPMTASVKKNDDDECVIEMKGEPAREVASKKTKKKHKVGQDSVSFELTLKSGSTVEVGKEREHEGRFPASAKVSVALDNGRAHVIEETLDCDVLYDFVQSLGCKIKKK